MKILLQKRIVFYWSLMALFMLQLGWGQTTLLTENFGTSSSLPTGWTSSNLTNGWNANTSSPSSTYSGFSAGTNALFASLGTNGTTHTLTYNNSFSTVGYNSITVLWGGRGTTTFAGNITFQWSSDGINWNNITYTYTKNGNSWALINSGTRISLPAGTSGISNLRFRWSSASTNSGNYRIDDFTVQGVLDGNTVTFDSNGGSGTMSNQTASTATNLTSNSYTRMGYTFSNWNTVADGSGTSYLNNASYPFTSNTTLYAQWAAITTPTITTTGSLSSLTTTYGAASSTSTFSVSGTALTADIVVTPPAGFEVSTNASSGFVSSVTLLQSSGTVSSTPIYIRLAATTNAGTYIGNVVLTSTGATDVNVATVSSTVNKKALTISGLTATPKEYDATTSVVISGTPSYTGLVNSESFSVSGAVSYAFASATSATPQTITRTGTYDAPSANYTVTQPTFTANITKKALTIASAVATNKNYDGTNTATITGTLNGVISPDAITLTLSGTFNNETVGTSKQVTSTSTISSTTNYTLTQPTGLTADIIAVVPTAPVIGTITGTSGQLSVAFTAPTNNGGTAITNYAYSIDNGTTFTTLSPMQTSSPIVITGLTNGTSYPVVIYAINSVGNGAVSTAVNGTPNMVTEATHYFRSNSSNTSTGGPWSTASNWQSSADGITWITSSLIPNSSANSITIRSGHNIDITASITVDQVVVESGGLLRNSQGTLTIANGAGTDLMVYGTFTKTTSATTIVTGTVSFESGSVYNHANTGAIFAASWNINSTCNITGITSGTPSGMGQTFGIVNWNCSNQTNFVVMGSNGFFNPKGLFTVSNTGSNLIELESSGSGATYNFEGGLTVSGGTLVVNYSTSSSPAEAILNIIGDLTISGTGIFDVCQGSASATTSGYLATINLSGNINLSSQNYALTCTSSNNYSRINFTGNGNHNYSRTSALASRYVDFIVPVNNTLTLLNSIQLFSSSTTVYDMLLVGGTLITNSNAVIQSSGSKSRFSLLEGGTIISSNSGGLVEAINVGGVKTFTAGSNYIFNSNTTTPYPTGTFGSPANLTFNANVVSNRTASITVTGSVIINSGATYSFNPASASDGFTLAGTMTIAAGGTFDSVGENNIVNSGGTGAVVVNGTFITRDVQGLIGTNTTLPSVSLTLNAGSTVNYGGINQTISPVLNYKNITLSGTGPFIVEPSTLFSFDETADFGGKSVIFKSDATGSARLAQVTGTLLGATNVKVERYIPLGKRAYRFLAPGVTTTNYISNNWQLATHITGSTTGANGFDQTGSGSPSMYTYNNQVGTGTGWTAIANTNATNLEAEKGYRLLVRGDRTPALLTTAAADNMNTAITLSAMGTLKTGDVTINASSTPVAINNTNNATTNGFSLVGNPYVSPIDWHTITKTNLNDTYYLWDANVGTSSQRGRYVSYSQATGLNNYGNTGVSVANRYIQSGQAFFVKNAVLGTAGSLTFHESDKVTSSPFGFRTDNQQAVLSVLLYSPTELALGGYPMDGITSVFGANFDNQIGFGDVAKLESAGENIAWYSQATKLDISAQAPVVSSDVLAIKSLRLGANKSYTFRIKATNFDPSLTGYLVDNYLNTQQEIDMSQDYFATFTTSTEALSYGEDRFKIVFGASLENEQFDSKSLTIYPNPVIDNQFSIQLPASLSGKLVVKIHNTLGQELHQVQTDAVPILLVNPPQVLAAGMYIVSVSCEGKEFQQKIMVK